MSNFRSWSLESKITDTVLQLDGSNDFVDLGDPGVSEGDAFTIEIWAKIPSGSSTSNPAVYSEGTPVNWDSDLLILHIGDDGNSGAAVVFIKDSSGTGGTLLTGSTDLRDDGWHHIALRQKDKSTRDLIVDDYVEATDTTTLGPIAVTDAYLGAADNDGTKTRFCVPNTEVLELRVWNDYRSGQELKFNKDRQLMGTESGLVGCWRLDEGSGTSLANIVSGGDVGTAFGSPSWVSEDRQDAPVWRRLTDDVRISKGIKFSYGIDGFGPLDRTANSGRLSFTLNNQSDNFQGLQGYYTPGHDNAPSGWELGTRIRTWLRMGPLYGVPLYGDDYYGSERWIKFVGTTTDMRIIPGTSNEQSVAVSVEDFIWDMSKHQMDLLDIDETANSGTVFQSILDNMDESADNETISTGQETFTFAVDDLKDEKSTALAAASKVVNSEFGHGYVKGGTGYSGGNHVVFEDRHYRINSEALYSFTAEEVNFDDVSRNFRVLFNHVETTVYPREEGSSTEVLWQLVNPIEISANTTRTITGRYVDPQERSSRISGKDLISLVQDTDYKFGSSEGGGSNDKNSDLTVTEDFGGNSVELTLENTSGSSGFVNLLQVRGTAIRIYEPVVILSDDTTSKNRYGKREFSLTLPYQDDPFTGKDLGDSTLSKYKNPQNIIPGIGISKQDSKHLRAITKLEPGDRITIQESNVSAINDDYFVQKISFEILPNNIIRSSLILKIASIEQAWLLGQTGFGELGDTTILGV